MLMCVAEAQKQGKKTKNSLWARAAALYGDKVYFGTLDARLVALDAKTGDVVWNKKIADYKAGYSYTAAPLIVNGLIITGNSGGEFGIVGEVQARAEVGAVSVDDAGLGLVRGPRHGGADGLDEPV